MLSGSQEEMQLQCLLVIALTAITLPSDFL